MPEGETAGLANTPEERARIREAALGSLAASEYNDELVPAPPDEPVASGEIPPLAAPGPATTPEAHTRNRKRVPPTLPDYDDT